MRVLDCQLVDEMAVEGSSRTTLRDADWPDYARRQRQARLRLSIQSVTSVHHSISRTHGPITTHTTASMDSNIPSEIASTIQAAHIKRHPSPRHDLNPSTAASAKVPVRLDEHPDPDALSDVAEDEIPTSILRPLPRHNTMPPLPDLRFEQSYLKSIERAESWQGVAWITVRDQVVMCFAQGVLWTLLLNGWRHWNRSAKFSGKGVGARLRRWWWGVNKWAIPSGKGLRDEKVAKNVSEVSAAFLGVRLATALEHCRMASVSANTVSSFTKPRCQALLRIRSGLIIGRNTKLHIVSALYSPVSSTIADTITSTDDFHSNSQCNVHLLVQQKIPAKENAHGASTSRTCRYSKNLVVAQEWVSQESPKQ